MSTPFANETDNDRVSEVVHELVSALASDPDLPIGPTTRLVDVGYDSLQLIELASNVEEIFTFDPDIQMPMVVSVSDLIQFVVEALAAGQAEIPSEHVAREVIERI